MRIVGEIQHPVMKVTIFHMNERYSVKLESGLYEQTYKFRSGEGLNTVEDVKQFVDEEFMEAVLQNFQLMNKLRARAMQRAFPQDGGEEFEKII